MADLKKLGNKLNNASQYNVPQDKPINVILTADEIIHLLALVMTELYREENEAELYKQYERNIELEKAKERYKKINKK